MNIYIGISTGLDRIEMGWRMAKMGNIYIDLVEQFDFPVSRNSLSLILKENSILFCSEN
jgi:hypothetical protein